MHYLARGNLQACDRPVYKGLGPLDRVEILWNQPRSAIFSPANALWEQSLHLANAIRIINSYSIWKVCRGCLMWAFQLQATLLQFFTYSGITRLDIFPIKWLMQSKKTVGQTTLQCYGNYSEMTHASDTLATKFSNGVALMTFVGFPSFRDDLLVTNPKRVQTGIDKKACNCLLLKVWENK